MHLLIFYMCLVCGVKPGIYIIYIISITFIDILAFLYNKLDKLRKEKPIRAVYFSLLKAWVLEILVFELNMHLLGGLFIAYLWYIFFENVMICHPTNILSFDDYSRRAEAIYNLDNISNLDKYILLTNEIIKVQTDIHNNTWSWQPSNNVLLPHVYVELTSFISTFNKWYKWLKSYTDVLFSSTGESAVQNNKLYSRYFPNSLGNDNLRFKPGFIDVQRIHALSVLGVSNEIYKVKLKWSLIAYDFLSDTRDYSTLGPRHVEFRELETRDLEQYIFIKNIVQKLEDANFNSKIEDGAIPVNNVLQNLLEHMHCIE